MEVAKNTVVEFTYRITDAADQLLEQRDEPTAALYGRHNIIRGLESALGGRSAGDQFDVTVEPEDAYGLRRPDWTQRVSKKYFAQPKRLKPGVVTQLNTESGVKPVTVIKVGSKVVDVDLNHPQAGKTLRFSVTITEVRAATREEIAHGHAHGQHGTHH